MLSERVPPSEQLQHDKEVGFANAQSFSQRACMPSARMVRGGQSALALDHIALGASHHAQDGPGRLVCRPRRNPLSGPIIQVEHLQSLADFQKLRSQPGSFAAL